MNDITSRRLFGLSGGLLLVILLGHAQAADIVWTGTAGNNNWNTPANWTGGNVPSADFEEVGIIDNSTSVFIAAPTQDAAGLVLGQATASSGALEVKSGGSVTFVDSTGAPSGAITVGQGGQGAFLVRPGASVTATSLTVSNQSSLTLGGTGIGTASLNINGAVTFGGTFIPQIASTTFAPINATNGVLTVGGTLKPMFVGGFSPTIGNKWNLADAVVINGTFANLDFSAVPAAPQGTAYQVATVGGGAHGRLLQLQYNALMKVTVDSATHAISMSSPSGTAINIVGYSLLSNQGSLNPAQWNSLHDQLGGSWQEAAPTTKALSDLNSNVSQSLAIGSTPVSLGTPYAFAPATFGVSPDISLEYATATGDIRQAQIEYVGNTAYNNLLLTVDPSNGNARLQNSSNFPVNLIGYSVLSASGTLKPANTGWSSLNDQGVSGWQEAAPTAQALSELIGLGGPPLSLSPGQSYFLGNLFNNASGVRDLSLEFALNGDAVARHGVVLYGSVTGNVPGDYNGNGIVDAADYTVWRDHLGQHTPLPNTNPADVDGVVTQAEYVYWKSRFGATSGAGSAATGVAAPEPSSMAILVVGMFAIIASSPLRQYRKLIYCARHIG